MAAQAYNKFREFLVRDAFKGSQLSGNGPHGYYCESCMQSPPTF